MSRRDAANIAAIQPHHRPPVYLTLRPDHTSLAAVATAAAAANLTRLSGPVPVAAPYAWLGQSPIVRAALSIAKQWRRYGESNGRPAEAVAASANAQPTATASGPTRTGDALGVNDWYPTNRTGPIASRLLCPRRAAGRRNGHDRSTLADTICPTAGVQECLAGPGRCPTSSPSVLIEVRRSPGSG
ncbi:hypothetical protein BIW11_04790 [Tropilaelaps mercedesae]|uniref:Uncharacterized protein n=1 Tax=Tropilaelaps mercedesae TaxID=418985 RepID=A0A1V9X167_9ACAR|nr:hypothetical protein BIW11_04790 [Tropilaelaps mercedesae]